MNIKFSMLTILAIFSFLWFFILKNIEPIKIFLAFYWGFETNRDNNFWLWKLIWIKKIWNKCQFNTDPLSSTHQFNTTTTPFQHPKSQNFLCWTVYRQLGDFSLGQGPVGESASWGKCHLGKYHLGEVPLGGSVS